MINWIISFFYAVGRFALGLLLHPYQTMQLLVRQRIFVWVVLTPAIFWIILLISNQYLIAPTLSYLKISCPEMRQVTSFFRMWISIFALYWQLMLFYLLLRFWSAQN